MSDRIFSLYRERSAREKGAIKKNWGGRISVALVYPNYYRTGMSSLGFQVIYRLLNKLDNVLAERFFLPDEKEMSLHLESGRGLMSLESLSPLDKFDLVAFSLSFENDYSNILKILELGKLPLKAEGRGLSHPFVMAGGITTFLNPEPISSFFDFFLIGEMENVLDEFIDNFEEMKSANMNRRDLLEGLAKNIESIYVPSLYRVEYKKDGTLHSMKPTVNDIPEKIKVARQKDGSDFPIASSAILTPDTTFSEKVLIELGRGCGRSCRFCAAGYVYRPPRVHEKNKILSATGKLVEEGSHVGLLSPALSDTPGIEELTEMVLNKGGSFSVSSLRADSLSEELVENLLKSGQKTIAIAPEAGSERLRKVINKHLTEDQIINAVRLIARKGRFALRLYFLIGLPTETKGDTEAIPELVKSIKHHVVKESRTRGNIGQIRLSVNCFIPKPFTPFQWFPMEHISTLKEKQKWLKKALAREGGVKINFDLPKWAYVQTLLSVGDRRVGNILHLAHKNNGDWKKAFRHSELNPDFFVYRKKDKEELLPWDFIEHGIHKGHLIKEYKMALKEKESDVCNVGDCKKCGVC